MTVWDEFVEHQPCVEEGAKEEREINARDRTHPVVMAIQRSRTRHGLQRVRLRCLMPFGGRESGLQSGGAAASQQDEVRWWYA
ncbi:hypothetical protein AC579_4434 [Pseudocercospora musae]|uniref:Uncharacterized protein n=1 Tax=Pseudocercospora musae TaxID=113226 RepID=A0A139I1K3_9PEZI|nr:hypothetical protein AC579_4434 [Pseudocercospora musae]